ncbi:hypothetical protein L1N85_24630 [Paenibacillus alkaliterrae]|uniref:hypothetical protein n=1 Tax=Paenibacillus alkaliterrae TaxID=320909 RepID=UPI001F3EBB2F|nr:hypothetical protein [Paenibacillus alkaliterrae]MCF2941528.1 hypothetical protein [Paenibacillus alkaliterrae]
MGREQRSGIGYGMNESAARKEFRDGLNRSYGDDTYAGGGNSITEWIKSVCEEKPVPSAAATKAQKVKVVPKAPGKLVNGFRITNETPELIRLQFRASHNSGIEVPPVVEEFTLTAGDASKKAEELAMKLNSFVHVIPARLWQDESTKRLSEPSRVQEVLPVGGKEAKPGKWRFEVEVSV